MIFGAIYIFAIDIDIENLIDEEVKEINTGRQPNNVIPDDWDTLRPDGRDAVQPRKFMRRGRSVVNLNNQRPEDLRRLGYLKKTSTGKFTMELDPHSEKCKKLIEECPDFLSTEDKLESINVGLTRIYLNSYNTYLHNLNSQTVLKELYITSKDRKTIPLNEGYIESILNFCSSTSSKIYLTKIELTAMQLKEILESSLLVKTFEMMNCQITDLSKEFVLEDNLDYHVKSISLRGAIEKKKFRHFAKEILRNKNFSKSLKKITVSKDLIEISKKYFNKTQISIFMDPCNK